KVGPKTAAKWLAQYKTLDGLVENADSVKGVAGNNLRAAIPNFPMTRQLVTIKTDCDIPELASGLSALQPAPVDRDTLISLYNEYGFRTWLRELTGDAERVPEQDSRQPQEKPEA